MPNQSDPNNPKPVVPTVDPVVPAPDSTFQIPDSSDVPPVPDFMNQGSTDSTVSPVLPASDSQSPTSDQGSAAPADFPDMASVTTPKKKFGGGKIIATILGLLVLIGGVGTGVYLTQQQQQLNSEAAKGGGSKANVQKVAAQQAKNAANVAKQAAETKAEKAKAANASAPGSGTGCGGNGNCDSGYHCSSGSCVADSGGGGSNYTGLGCGGRGNCTGGYSCNKGVCYNDTSGKADPGWADLVSSESGCNANTGGIWCTVTDVGGANHSFCTSSSGTGCNTTALDLGYTIVTGCANSDGTSGKIVNGACVTDKTTIDGIYLCPVGTSECIGSQYKVSSRPSCFCGVVQIDYVGGGHSSYNGRCGCSGGGGEKTTITTTDSASCQNVKAYNTSWVELTSAQLSVLKSGSSVKFCVVGAATAGTFDKAQFTINGVVQAETTIQRPSTQDYCQNYTIPAGVSSFTVTAKIHHVTLGWF